MVGVEWLSVDAGWIGGREVCQPPILVFHGHLRVQPADGRLMKLHMTIRRSILPPEGDFRLRRTRLPDEADFLSDFAPVDHLEPPGEKLKGTIDRTRRASHGLFRTHRSFGGSFEP